VLDERQVEWIIRARERGGKNEDIARVQNITARRVRQLYSIYRRTGAVPVLKRPGRPKSPELTLDERDAVVRAFETFRLCACYLEKVLCARGSGSTTGGFTSSSGRRVSL
jgi:hypothetical protein